MITFSGYAVGENLLITFLNTASMYRGKFRSMFGKKRGKRPNGEAFKKSEKGGKEYDNEIANNKR